MIQAASGNTSVPGVVVGVGSDVPERTDPERFRLYTNLVRGREAEPARAIRERFGARWVTVWKVPAYKAFATELVRSGQATIAFADPFYLVLDLGEPAGSLSHEPR